MSEGNKFHNLFQVYGDGNYQRKDSNTQKAFSWTKPLLDFVGTNFLPLGK